MIRERDYPALPGLPVALLLLAGAALIVYGSSPACRTAAPP